MMVPSTCKNVWVKLPLLVIWISKGPAVPSAVMEIWPLQFAVGRFKVLNDKSACACHDQENSMRKITDLRWIIMGYY